MRVLKEIRSLIGNYHVKSGVYHYYRREYTQATEFLRRALRDSDKLGDSDERKAQHYLTLSLMDAAEQLAASESTDAAIESLEQAALVSPEFPDIHFRAGGLFERLDQRERAIESYRRAVECNPNYLEAQVALGFCLLGFEDGEGAAVAFKHALDLRRRQIGDPVKRGLESLEAGRVEQASESFFEAFCASPALSHERVRAALDYLRAENYEDALGHFDRAIELNPKFPDLHNYRGVCLVELDRAEEAIGAFELSAALSPRYLVPRLNLAFARARAGQLREAEADLEMILEKEPTESAAAAKLEELRTAPPVDNKRRPAARGGAR